MTHQQITDFANAEYAAGGGGMTQRETKELKPCPFCGSEAEIKKNSSIGWFFIDEDGNFIEGDCGFVFCRNCRIRTEETDEAEAIEAWNRRQEMSEITHKPTVSEFKRMAVQLGYEKVVHGQLEDQYGKKYSNHRFVCPHCGAAMDGEADT